MRSGSFSGVVQLRSRPYFFEEFGRGNSGFEVDTLQAYAGYERFWGGKYVTVKAGLLPAAFGSFSLRYDDAVNPMIGLPAGYGYYASPVTTLGLSGAQVDVGNGRADARVQFTSSSPANPRGITEDGQYGTWTTGFGVSPVQGLRIGTSGYRGPYLHDNHRFNRPGEIHSRALPATAAGLDVQFARGHWYFNGELNRLRLPYTAIPNLNRTMAWAEAKYVPHPRWYLAGRLNHSSSNLIPTRDVCELAVGYRPQSTTDHQGRLSSSSRTPNPRNTGQRAGDPVRIEAARPCDGVRARRLAQRGDGIELAQLWPGWASSPRP